MKTSVPSQRHLPAMNSILDSPRVVPLCELHGRDRVRDWARIVLSRRRADPGNDAPQSPTAIMAEIIDELALLIEQTQLSRLRRVINGTGVILHTNLGRAPLPEAALESIRETAACSNLELDLASGRRGQRGSRVESLWCELTGAESALVVNNCAAATLLTLRGLARGREAIISRGQLIEIGGSYRLPDVFAEADVRLREVGTTNRTRLADYEAAIGEETAAILRVHQSNYRQVGFTESVSTAELSELARRCSLPLIDDIGSGLLVDLSQAGLHDEPTVMGSLQSGADLVLFSGDKLVGGPQCGMILGRRSLIEQIRRSPLTRAVRVDKLTLAALEATLQIYLAGRQHEQIPVLRAILQPLESLRERAHRICAQITDAIENARVEVHQTHSTIGGGSLPGETLPSWGLSLSSADCGRLAAGLRSSEPALIACLRQGRVLVDLRTVAPADDAVVSRILIESLRGE